MIEERINLERIPHFNQSEFERRMDDVLQLVDEGQSPVVLHDSNGRRFLLFGWEDYFRRFGWLYSNEEIAAIEAACAEYEEYTSNLSLGELTATSERGLK